MKILSIIAFVILTGAFISAINVSNKSNSSNSSISVQSPAPIPREEESSFVFGNYVDEFGSSTGRSYFSLRKLASGSFSNTATDDSPLLADILVDKNRIAIQLYKYGQLLLKSNSEKKYSVDFKARDGSVYYSYATLHGDRIYVQDIQAFDKAMKMGGTIQFAICPFDSKTTKYNFSIVNVKDYDKFREKL